MSTNDTIKRLETLIPGDWSLHYANFEKTAQAQQPELFYGYLVNRGLITARTFIELHTLSPLSLIDINRETTGNKARYTDLGKLGEGAMGTVQIYSDSVLARKVAVKLVNGANSASADLTNRFIKEAQITAQLDHPNIVPVYNFETDPEKDLAYTMKLIRGVTLTDLISQTKRAYETQTMPDIPLDERLSHFLKVCDALHYAHAKGVDHRDLKPDNIMIGPFNEVYVMDWGIARLMENTEVENLDGLSVGSANSSGTMLGTVIGTAAYMSPEQAEGRNNELTGQSDQFAMGLILQELVTLQPAVTGDSAIVMISKVQAGRLEPIEHIKNKYIPRDLAAIILRATQLEPHDRYPNVHELATDIRRFIKNEETVAYPDNSYRSLIRWAGKHSALILSGTLALGFLLAAVVISSLFQNQIQREAASAREETLSNLIASSGRQGQYIDQELQRYQGILAVMSTQIENNIDHASPRKVRERAYGKTAYLFSPDDLLESVRYDRKVSLLEPVLSFRDDQRPQVQQINAIYQSTTALKHALLQSGQLEEDADSDVDARQVLFSNTGVPLAWAIVSFDDGVTATYPGHSRLSEGYDASMSNWFESHRPEARGAIWGTRNSDENQLDYVLPCVQNLFDSEDNHIGKAALMLPYSYIIDDLISMDALPESTEAFLLNDKQKIVVRESMTKGMSANRKVRRLKEFPYDGLNMKGKESGFQEIVTEEGERKLIIYHQLTTIDWTYVLVGDANTLLSQ
jgi:serine/threonine protein kinase